MANDQTFTIFRDFKKEGEEGCICSRCEKFIREGEMGDQYTFSNFPVSEVRFHKKCNPEGKLEEVFNWIKIYLTPEEEEEWDKKEAPRRELELLGKKPGADWNRRLSGFLRELRDSIRDFRKELFSFWKSIFEEGVKLGRWRVKPYFKWFDLWVGLYWDRLNRALYIGVPMFGVRIDRLRMWSAGIHWVIAYNPEDATKFVADLHGPASNLYEALFTLDMEGEIITPEEWETEPENKLFTFHGLDRVFIETFKDWIRIKGEGHFASSEY